MKIVKIILTIALILIAMLVLFGNVEANTVMPYLFACLGLAQILNGINSYKQNSKREGILIILSGLFAFSVVINSIIK